MSLFSRRAAQPTPDIRPEDKFAAVPDTRHSCAVMDGDVRESSLALLGARLTGEALITAAQVEQSPVELGIFDWVVDWADAMADGNASYMDKWKPDHPLVRFGEHFWMDMCRSVYDWRGVSLPTIRRAVDLHMDHGRHALHETYATSDRGDVALFSAQLDSLMFGLEDWLHATRSTSYGPDEICVSPYPAGRQILASDVQEMCERAVEWARSVGLSDLQFEASRAVEAFKRGT